MLNKELTLRHKQFIFAYLKIALANVILGFAYAHLMVPNKIINGGVTSLSLIVYQLFHVSITTATNVLTILLLLMGWWKLGRHFFISSIFSSCFYLVCFNLFSAWSLKLSWPIWLQFVLAVVLISLGYFLCISENSSTAGLDVIAILLNRKWPSLSVAKLLNYLNWSVLLIGLLTYGARSVLIGLLFSFCFSKVLGTLLNRYRTSR
ncbi:hypothetical protein FC84_GL001068 [Lapidilactobacillus dextrinicus DSM 20335]|uniref:Integral membrane protein n=1 Tax=Lapidilactobacillus dextrinicus DSM 20335 TaxID=1423738 RepID=A0A0R2BJA2_9LACO|nr:YitT family protein [Lapidilactobacillus dextrinicus]KRM79599.1 hypothetical protein FC84_GL001068 [Lapidilactobacillus dextrinicus DSM 20335]QFG47389.1 YitT family protein [Lapidilactobacillus dextrinicus]